MHLSILLVTNQPKLQELLAKQTSFDMTITQTAYLGAALEHLSHSTFDLIFTDLFLPSNQGFNIFLSLLDRAQSAAIIIVGENEEIQITQKALQLGAQDVLFYSLLNTDLMEKTIIETLARNQFQQGLKSLSFTDPLTGLYNRRGFFSLLEQHKSLSLRSKKSFYLFIIDVDALKQINDREGHLAGDRALTITANCLRSALRQHDIIGRIGGDEFALIALNAPKHSLNSLTNHIMDSLAEYNEKANKNLSFSLGSAYFDGIHDITIDQLVEEADRALYKNKGRLHRTMGQ